jgi:calcineurin-like phosphoesterase family protein
MPIHLSPLSRREFLVRSMAAAAGLALAPALQAASKKTDPDLWTLLADPHLAADPALVSQGINMTEHFQSAATEIIEGSAVRPAGAIIAGDLAFSSGQKADYAHLVEMLKPMRKAQIPIHLALGNHDQRENFREVLRNPAKAKAVPADRQAMMVKAAKANWFVLDSLETTLSTPGLLGAGQLEWLAETLDKNPKKPALVVVHHNPGKKENISGLKDTEELMAILRPRRQVKMLIYGHTHNWSVERDAEGIHLVNLPPVAYVFKKGNPSGWVQFKLEGDAVLMELRCVDPNHPAQGQRHRLDWRA